MSQRTDQPATQEDRIGGAERVWRAGRTGWAMLGLVGVALVVGYLTSRLSLLVVPVILALFPATLLVPLAGWLRARGVPAGLAAIGTILAGILLIAAVIGGMVPLVIAEIPDLAESASDGVAQIEELLAREPFGVQVGGLTGILEAAREQVGEVGQIAPQALSAAVLAFETVAGLLLLFVVLFFYLKDGRRLVDGPLSLFPQPTRHRLEAVMERSWTTLGSYFRGQLMVALVDAVFIGLGLVLLGVPLAVPLAVVVFFGGLFPIVGAVVTGALAVLVALADAGLTTALIVLALVVAVQQLESNVLEPVILSRAIDLHPLVVLLSITAGALMLGILGAFLAVPTAAILARAVQYLREEAPREQAEPPRQRAEAAAAT
jgi:putative heme transporter